MSAEQKEINYLKSSIHATEDCMKENQCMGEGECPDGKSPVDCFMKLESERTQVEILQ
jgi:hypothetical protein